VTRFSYGGSQEQQVKVPVLALLALALLSTKAFWWFMAGYPVLAGQFG
jgi:hypothetical protein